MSEDPPRPRWKRFLRWLAEARAEGWLVVATLLIALGTAIWGYLSTTEQARNANVLKLQERWVSTEMQARHSRVVDALLCKYPQFRADSLPRSVALDRIAIPDEDYVGLSGDLGPYLEFFDEAKTCVDNHHCNLEPACTLWASDAATLASVFRRTIDRRRYLMDSPDWAREIEDFAQLCRREAPHTVPTGKRLEERNPPKTDERTEAKRRDYEGGGATRKDSDAACERMKPGAGSNALPARAAG